MSDADRAPFLRGEPADLLRAASDLAEAAFSPITMRLADLAAARLSVVYTILPELGHVETRTAREKLS